MAVPFEPTPVDLSLGDEGEDHPRRLLKIGKDILAYGGEHGTISLVSQQDATPKVVRRFDDAIRAVAVSHNGKRVAVGFDDGSTQIFVYENGVSGESHAFIAQKQNEHDDDDFLSQGDEVSAPKDETSFPGPRFDAPVRHMQFDPRSNHLCIASESGVCIVDVTSSSSLQERLLQQEADKHHDASGIRGVAYSQVEDKVYLATLDMTGRLCVWDVSGDDPDIDWELLHRDAHKCITKPDVGEIHDADPYDRSCLPVMVKQSSVLVLPGMTDVQLRLLDNPKEQHFLVSLPDKGHSDSIVAMESSPDGRHIVTSGRDGRVVAWAIDVEDESKGSYVCQLGQFDSIPTHMLWDELNGEETLHMACANGTLLTIQGRDKIILSETSSSEEAVEEEEEEDTANFETQPLLRPEQNHAAKASNDLEDSDDDVDFSADSQGVKKKSVSFVADEADEEDDDDDDDESVVGPRKEGDTPSAAAAAAATTTSTTETGGDDEDDYDMGGVDDDFGDFEDNRPSSFVPTASLPEPQPPFAPSATPLELARRIMCWNQVGTISYQRDEEGGTRNTVDIDFTDSATRRPISFSDNMDFILGSLGDDGAIFASDVTGDDDDDMDGDEDGKIVDGLNMSDRTKKLLKRSLKRRMNKGDGRMSTGSKVYFHRFETFGSSRDKDWLLSLPDGERVLGCACGEGWAAVVTSRRFLRLFSSGGNQGQVIWLKGDPVAVVGRGKFLAVIYHQSSPLPDGTQQLGYTLFDADSYSAITSGSVSSISSGSQLEWAGFSNDGALIVLDSDGMLSMLVTTSSNMEQPQYSWDWSPMLDTVGLRKSADDKFWPITVQDGKLVCVPLKGGNQYPDAARRPVTTALPFRMPFARSVVDNSSTLEEVSLRANLALAQKKFVNELTAVDDAEKEELDTEYDDLCTQVDKVTLKLFLNMVKAGKLESALDLVDRFHLENTFDVAVTMSDRLNHQKLSERIEDKKDIRFPLDDGMEDDNVEDKYEYDAPFGKYASDDEDESMGRRRISPDGTSSRGFKRSMDAASDEEDNEDEKWGRPEKKFRGEKAKKSLMKPSNPFAKKRLESPMKRGPSVSPGKSPSKLSLSRSSTFSAKSREKSKVSKRIL